MKHIPTFEQKTIIETAKTGVNIAIHAGAGCTKTSTCVLVANAITKPSLYIAFNKSIAVEAEGKFPEYVDCRTLHSLAYEAIIKKTSFAKKGRLVGYWDKKEIEGIINDSSIDVEEIIEILKSFCQSSETNFSALFYDREFPMEFLDSCELVWEKLTNANNAYKINHDIYLKIYQLSKPDLSKEYKIIFLDEFQDTNPVCLDIFLSQQDNGVQLIAVGDEAQAIYAWRGAVNAFDYIPKEHTEEIYNDELDTFSYRDISTWRHLTLSESFRFGPSIAEYANITLSAMGSSLKLSGRGTNNNVKTKATLVRNNSTLFSILLAAADTKSKVKVVADLKDLYSKLWTAFYIRNSSNKPKTEYGLYPDAYMKGFKDWKTLCASADPEAKKIVNILSICNNITWENISGLKAAIAKANSAIWNEEKNEGEPDFILSTAHKSKGLEWDEVTLMSDLLPTVKEGQDFDDVFASYVEEQGLNLLYVAITRARTRLNLSYEFEEFLEYLFELGE